MPIVRIEHPIPDFDRWKAAFDSDPVGRRQSGVRRYEIARPVDDPRYVLVDLWFDTAGEAERFVAAMRALWSRVDGKVMRDPQVRIVETVETRAYSP